MSESAPRVTVLMPVYNGSRWLAEAIESILGQTFRDFELLIINDGSRDDSGSVVKRYPDPRILYFEQSNRGLAATLNEGLRRARGRYVARMDQDDVSRPDRLARQVEFLDANPEVAMVGTWARILSDHQPTDRMHRHPCSPAEIAFFLLFDNPFVHASVMFRADAVRSLGGYTEVKDRQPPEDYELWSRLARRYPLANLPMPLLDYREVSTSMSREGQNPFLRLVLRFSMENLASAARISDPQQAVVEATAHYIHAQRPPNATGVSYVAMERLVRRAAMTVATGHAAAAAEDLESSVACRLRDLRHHYLNLRYGQRRRRVLKGLDRVGARLGLGLLGKLG